MWSKWINPLLVHGMEETMKPFDNSNGQLGGDMFESTFVRRTAFNDGHEP